MSLDNGFVTAEYLHRAAQMAHSLKQASYARMPISPGDTLLDVGCGPGVDTVPLTELVDDNGRVIGIDSDQGMLDEANRLAGESEFGQRIEHGLGSALALPLADASVDACRAERLLQVLPPEDEQAVVSEMVRVTRPGGRIVLVDTDWGSASVDFSDASLERRLMTFFALKMRPNGLAGRRLYGLCQAHGLEGLRIELHPMLQRRLDDTPFGSWLTTTATETGTLSETEAQAWLDELQERERQQRFIAWVNMVIVSGRKPVG